MDNPTSRRYPQQKAFPASNGVNPVFKALFLLPAALVAASASLVFFSSYAQAPKGKMQPQWIWFGKARENQTVYFRKDVVLNKKVAFVRLVGTCDNHMTVYINGKEVVSSDSWEIPVSRDVTEF